MATDFRASESQSIDDGRGVEHRVDPITSQPHVAEVPDVSDDALHP